MPTVLDELLGRAQSGRLFSPGEPLMPPVTERQAAEAEARLGFPLPTLLRNIYLHVANGGFGPAYGLFPLSTDTVPPDVLQQWTLVETYTSFRHTSERTRWDEKLLPVCTWGCSYFSFLDCALARSPVFAFDEGSHGHGPWDCAFSLHDKSFEQWMRRWLDGEDLGKSLELYGEPKTFFEEKAADKAPVHLSRNYNVAPDTLFDAWLTPGVAQQWLFKGPDFVVVGLEMDARVDGRYSIRMNTGRNVVEYSGVYEAVERPHRLAFSLQVPALFKETSHVSIEIVPMAGGSRLDFTQTGSPGRTVVGAWNDMLDALERLLAPKS